MFGVWDRACESCGCDKTYHVEGEVNDRGEKMADIYVEKMTLKVGHVWIQGK